LILEILGLLPGEARHQVLQYSSLACKSRAEWVGGALFSTA